MAVTVEAEQTISGWSWGVVTPCRSHSCVKHGSICDWTFQAITCIKYKHTWVFCVHCCVMWWFYDSFVWLTLLHWLWYATMSILIAFALHDYPQQSYHHTFLVYSKVPSCNLYSNFWYTIACTQHHLSNTLYYCMVRWLEDTGPNISEIWKHAVFITCILYMP